MKHKMTFLIILIGVLMSTFAMATSTIETENGQGIINFIKSDFYICLALVGIAIVLIIFLKALFPSKNNLPDYMPERHGNLVQDAEEYELIHQMTRLDSKFDKESFVTYAKKLFINLEKAWSEKKLSVMKMYEDENLLEEHTKQIQYFEDHGQINVIDMIVVRTVDLYSVKEGKDKNEVSVLLTCSMIDYIKEEKTDKVISGNREERVNKTYLMTFTRPREILSNNQVDTKLTVVKCPNCGEMVKLSTISECTQCGIFVRADKNDWILSDMKLVENP